MPTRPGQFRFSDPDYAQQLAQDPLLTGGAIFNPEDDIAAIKKVLEGLFTARPGSSLPEIEASADFLKNTKAFYKQPSIRQKGLRPHWSVLAEEYMKEAMGEIPQALHKPGLVQYAAPWHNYSAYLNKALEPMATIDDWLESSPKPTIHISSLGRSFDPKHGILPTIGTIKLMKDLAQRSIKEGAIIDPGIFSEYTANMLKEAWDAIMKRGIK